MSTKTILSVAASAAALCICLPVKAQSLTGSQVTGAGYCCTSPSESDRVTNLQTATVGPTIEFPSDSFVPTSSGFAPVPANIDFGANTLDISYTAAASALSGGFNGYVFSFAGAPAITGVSVDPSSTYFPAVSFNANTIFVNEAGLELTSASRVLVNIAAVPEPSSLALLFAGLAFVAFAGRDALKKR